MLNKNYIFFKICVSSPQLFVPTTHSDFLLFCFTAILFRYTQPLPHVQSVRFHLDTTERALPEPLPTREISPHNARVTHQPASLPLQSGARGRMPTHPVLQLQPVWATHEPGHMELFVQPQLQLTAVQ